MPTRQTTIRLTPATDRQLDELQSNGFGTVANIIAIAVDRMHREEIDTMNTASARPAHVYLDTSEDSLFGHETPPENADNLRAAFVTMVEQELSEQFPELDVTVIEVEHGQRIIFPVDDQDNDDRTVETMLHIIGKIYGEMEWAET